MIDIANDQAMRQFGIRLGAMLHGGECIELVGDVGAGKTTLTKGIALGLSIDEPVQSPTFTISRLYDGRNDITLAHYDFYRLQDAGIMANELDEVARNDATVTVVEWGGIVNAVLPNDRLTIMIAATGENERSLTLRAGGDHSKSLLRELV